MFSLQEFVDLALGGRALFDGVGVGGAGGGEVGAAGFELGFLGGDGGFEGFDARVAG